jgi:predicted phage terminase large subunit-like protein
VKKREPTDADKAREALRWMCKTDLYVFAKDILGYKDLTESFHKPIAEFHGSTPHRRNLYMVQRGGFKTSLLSIAANIQRILRNPDIRILIASNKLENAEAILAEIKGHLANPLLLDLFPDILYPDPTKSPVWTTSRIAVKTTARRREPTITAIGLHGELVGRHYDHATFDDMVGLENSATREERQKAIEWWQAAQAILDPGSTEDIVGCLPADAAVLMHDGTTKPIVSVKPGEVVWAADVDGSLTARAVKAMVPQGEAQTLTITTSAKTLRATPNHPFLCHTEKGLHLFWRRADELKVGDYIVSIKPPGALVYGQERIVSVTPNDTPEPVYDLTVEGTPSFFANGLAVHNTPWDQSDLYAYLQERATKHGMQMGVYKRPCWEADPDGFDVGPPFGRVRSTFPERFPVDESQKTTERQEALLTLRKSSPIKFAAFYLLSPMDDDEAVFPRAKKRVEPRRNFPPIETLWIVGCVDPAISQKGHADYTANAVVGFDHENTMWVLHLNRGRWAESKVIEEVYASYLKYRPTTIGIEAVGFQKMFFHLFSREGEQRGFYLPLMKLERDTRITKQTRIRVLEPLWNAGQIVLADDLPVLDEFLEEAARFRVTKEADHDDMLDALADCLQLRVRPHAPDPVNERLSSLEPHEAERARHELAVQEQRAQMGAPPLDAPSLRMAYSIQRRIAQIEQQRQEMVIGVGEGWP